MSRISLMPEGFHQSRVPENKRFIILSSGLVALTIIFYLFFILLSSITQNSIDKINASISESDQIINEAKMISEDLSIDQLGEFKKRLRVVSFLLPEKFCKLSRPS